MPLITCFRCFGTATRATFPHPPPLHTARHRRDSSMGIGTAFPTLLREPACVGRAGVLPRVGQGSLDLRGIR